MRLLLGTLLAVAACGGDDGGGPGTLDAATSSDAASSSDAPSPGLTVTWTAQPPIPGPFEGNVLVTSVKVELARLEVIGDAGSTNDTTQNNFDITWSATQAPPSIAFFTAQPGLYSKVSLAIDGDVVAPSYEILGTVMIGGTTEPFKISDTAALEVDIDNYDIQLTAGRSMTVPIRFDLDDALDAIDFAMLPKVGGVRTMDQTTPGIQAVRDAFDTTVFRRGG